MHNVSKLQNKTTPEFSFILEKKGSQYEPSLRRKIPSFS